MIDTQTLPGRVTAVSLAEVEAALLERYSGFVRLAYLILPPPLGRHQRILAAHGAKAAAVHAERTAKVEDTVQVPLAGVTRYQCPNCEYVYDESQGDAREGWAAGTPIADIPADWGCPDCGVRERVDFVPLRDVASV